MDRATLERLGSSCSEVPQGGDVTWHGQGSSSAIRSSASTASGATYTKHLRLIEEALIRAMGRYGIVADRSRRRTGVWVGPRKLASIGVAVRRWSAIMASPLNVCPDLAGFSPSIRAA